MQNKTEELLEAVKETSTTIKLSVVKRNGTIVPFNGERIRKAIELAFRDTKKVSLPNPLPTTLAQTIERLANSVIERALELGKKGVSLSVEGIQDIVEVTLMKNGYHDVARDYIIYRNHHKAARESHPSNIRLYRKDGSTKVRFNPVKIASTLEKLFRHVAAETESPLPTTAISSINDLTQKIVDRVIEEHVKSRILTLHDIEDLFEELLMKNGFYRESKFFILARTGAPTAVQTAPARTVSIITEEGGTELLSEEKLKGRIAFACKGFTEVSQEDLLEATLHNCYEGIKEQEIDTAMIMAARAMVEIDPAYSYVTARLLLDKLYRETLEVSAIDQALEKTHREYFASYITTGISLERLSPELLNFDLDKLAQAMDLSRDLKFQYLGLQTLYDRYFIHHREKRLETPQIFWMRVAMGLCIKEENKNERAIEFYNVLSQLHYTPGTPTLFNSGTMHSQLSSCYLSTVEDDLIHIFKVISDDAQLSKWAGGLGNDWTNVRAIGSLIKGTNGRSQGVIPFLKVANDTAVAVNQCFAPDTRIFTHEGIKPIANVAIGDLVLGISGTYRKVTKKFVYNQKDPMIALDITHSLESVHVTTAHPFYAIQGVPLEQANTRTYNWLEKGKVAPAWVEANNLKVGDYVAQVIPKEVVAVPEFTEEDARLYGILLGDGHLSKQGSQWGVSGNPQKDEHLEFVREYLQVRGIHFWETQRGTNYLQIHWAAGKGALQSATTGRFVSAGEPTLPFEYEDIYDQEKCKHIAPRFAHLPKSQTIALLQGLLETDGNVSRGKEISFTNTSLHLVEGIRYQCLRLGIPTAGNRRVRINDHVAMREDGSTTEFKGTTICYDLRIPAFDELAARLQCEPVTKQNWLTTDGCVWSRVTGIDPKVPSVAVCDLVVEGDESYMTVAGLAHNGGKRKGALCSYLETWHLDIEDFLELRKNTGDERRRTHDMNTANWIPDLFMKRVQANESWTLFTPSETPDLHDLYGSAFEKRYVEYEKLAELGKIHHFKKVEAVTLWRKMISMLFETGHPWITFKDPSNIRSPQDHVGVVHSSNLCTEIFLNTSKEEVAVCNIGSVNLPEHFDGEKLDKEKLARTVRTAIRMLDNVIDVNYYPIKEAELANRRHRAIGLGLMGFQDILYMKGISYASHDAIELADRTMEMISYYAILSSSELAKERGTYSSYEGSKWSRGILPIDTIDILEKERGQPIQLDRGSAMDWSVVREHVKKHGMRNCNTMAIAPTATIANIVGITASIEPTYKNLFVKSNLSGEFTTPNPHLILKLKELGLWDPEMLDDLKYYDGSLAEIERIPKKIKEQFLTAFEVDPDWVIECGARRQKWIDMGQSLNLYSAETSGKKLNDMYMKAWNTGLKSTYYLRSLGATQVEKSTTDVNKRGLQPRWMKHASASSNVQVNREPAKPKACTLGGECESCQ